MFYVDGKIEFIRFKEVEQIELDRIRLDASKANTGNEVKVIETTEKDTIVFKAYR